MVAKTLTAANAVLQISVAGLYTVPQQIQGFANDEAFNFDDVDTAETVMGVDGILSTGWIPKELVQTIVLQADSDSVQLFEDWYAAQQQARENLIASGTVIYPSVQRQYNMVRGTLRGYSPTPGAKRILQPRKFSIVWNYVEPAAYLGF